MAFKLKGSPMQRNFGISPMKDDGKKYVPTKDVVHPTKGKAKQEHDEQAEWEIGHLAPSLVQEEKDSYVPEKGRYITSASDTASFRGFNPNIKYQWVEKKQKKKQGNLYHLNNY